MLPTNKPYLIGETAFHHEGDVGFLLTLIEHAKDIGVDAIKGHMLLDLDDYMVADHAAIDALRPWCLKAEEWDTIAEATKKAGFDLILLCNDALSLDWVLKTKHTIKAIELHATGINDFFLLQKAAEFKGTVILGSGGSTIEEIQYAIDMLKSNGQEDIFLMHGFQNYPTDFRDINLSKMSLLNKLFGLPVGYADHTDPADNDNATISVLGAAQGFNVLEKHFTHLFGEKRIDAQAAVSLDTMKHIKVLQEKAFASYGSNSLEMSAAEKKYGNTGPMKKALVARADIVDGQTLTLEDIAFKRTNSGTYVSQTQLAQILGNKATRNIAKDELLDFSNVAYDFSPMDFSQFQNTKK